MHGGRPHGVFEVVPNANTSHVPPDPNPGDDVLLELSPNHDHSNGASDRYAENADTAVPDPEASYHSISHRKWGRYRSEIVEKLPRVCQIAERADTVALTTATKERVETAVSSTSSRRPRHDEHTTACERNPQRERRQPSQTPQHRTTYASAAKSKTRAETAVSRNSSGTTALPKQNGECPQAAKRVDTATQDTAASHA